MTDTTTQRLAKTLGWASLGLGAAQLAMPRRVARLAGVDDSATARALIPAVGARELVHAAGLLAGRATWTVTRVAGDAMDLAALGVAAASREGERRRRALLATGAVAGIAALDVYTALRARRAKQAGDLPRKSLTATVTVNRPAADVYAFWRDLENLPTFMAHLESVTVRNGMRSHWVAKAPGGRTVEWDAEITDDSPNRLIAWRSVPSADVANSGSVRFAAAPGGRGTEIRVELDYDMPGGKLGTLVAKLFGEEPEQQVRDDLRRCKQVLETGEVVVSDGSPDGTKARRLVAQRKAQPVETPEPALR
ncbi:MAG TPA: SRPBCC family protein [Mycobacteriales bacterium]|jgi:uncharacterized membrane protein|nr:SRPBCC family protein [Mycobacteriales bacterium]